MPDSASATERPKTTSAWLSPRRKRFWAVIAVLIYTLVGFFVAPWVARGQLVALIGDALNRPVSLRELRINPYVLSIEAEGFRIDEPNGGALVEIERLYANLQLSSIVRRALVFRELRVDTPRINVVRDETFTINLLEVYRGIGDEKQEPETDAGTSLPGIIVAQLEIASGVLDIADRALATPFETELGPIDISLANVSTRPNEAGEQRVSVTSEGGTRLGWSGSLQLTPLIAEGRVALTGPYLPLLYRYFQDQLNFAVAAGTLDLQFDYRIELPPGGVLTASIDDLSGSLIGITATADDRDAEILVVPETRLRGGYLSWPARRAGAEALDLDGVALEIWRDADGSLIFSQLLATAPVEDAEDAAADNIDNRSADPVSPDPVPWQLGLGSLRLNDARIALTDNALTEPARVEIPDIDFVAADVTNEPDAQIPLQLAVDLIDRGRIAAEGSLSVAPKLRLETSVSIEALALSIAQPWVGDATFLNVREGVLNAGIDAKIDGGDEASVNGSASVANLDVEDSSRDERLLGWSGLNVDRFKFTSAGNAIEISQIQFDKPFVRLLIAADGTTNFSGLVRERATSADSPEGLPAEQDNAQPPLDLKIGRITVADGNADFTDLTLPFPFNSRVRELAGQVSTLATKSRSPTTFELEGKVDEFGFARLEGSLLPADPTAATDVSVLFRNVEFPGLSPYTIKFAGRRIEEGRLEVALDYRIEKGQLDAQNSVVIQRIKLGEKVDYPGAMNLPLGLAIALLQNPSGQISIDLPIKGNVNDPEFSVGGVVVRAFANLITKAATSPFKLLGGLVGTDSENFDRIEFEPGQADLTPPEREKLGQLAGALGLRPTLSLSVPGAVDPATDALAMRTARVNTKVEGLLDAETADAEMITERRRDAVEKLFREKFPDERLRDIRAGFMVPVDPGEPDGKQTLDELAFVERLRERLIEAEPVARADLDALAIARADAVVTNLTLAEQPVAAERIERGDTVEVKAGDRGFIALKLELRK